MKKKQILVLSLLAAGIGVELILMAGMLTGRGHSELTQALSTSKISIAMGDNKKNDNKQATATITVMPEVLPLIDEDHPAGSEPDAANEATPVFADPGEEEISATSPADALSFPDAPALPEQDAYPAPDSYGYAGDPVSEGSGYPAPPTLPPTSPEVLPTDVPAVREDISGYPAPPEELPTDTPAAPELVETKPAAETLPAAEATRPLVEAAPATAIPTQPVPTLALTAQPPQNTPDPASQFPTQTPSIEVPSTVVSTLTAMPGSELFSARVKEAPKIDGKGSDSAWSTARAIEIETSGGANHSATRVKVQSVYDSKRVYFLFSWSDPTNSFERNPWEKQADGSWKLLTSPDSGFNDENRYYEDKLALLWPAKDVPDFSTQGCGSACHTGENPEKKPYGNMYTPAGLADLWQWKSVRGAGQMDDQYLSDTRFSSDDPAAGFHPDPNDGGGYRLNRNKNKNGPAYMLPGGSDKSGAPGYIREEDKVKLDPKLFAAGDRVPGILTAPFQGDRGDLHAAWQYQDGRWTLEVQRDLVTGSIYDVQFDDLDKTYTFGLATFDNAQVRHAVQNGVNTFQFEK